MDLVEEELTLQNPKIMTRQFEIFRKNDICRSQLIDLVEEELTLIFFLQQPHIIHFFQKIKIALSIYLP